ncbi:hypothetical protein GGR50DRAFT_655799 [Xylaria sp. CBS 124048]|nr:hypothetical protein GGR50DRAFT_655799 [Xylaria sp. CBS 124048]
MIFFFLSIPFALGFCSCSSWILAVELSREREREKSFRDEKKKGAGGIFIPHTPSRHSRTRPDQREGWIRDCIDRMIESHQSKDERDEKRVDEKAGSRTPPKKESKKKAKKKQKKRGGIIMKG